MELRELRGFVAAARERDMAKAAARLGVTPAALGRSVQKLEQELGARLLVADQGGLVPTDCGEVLLARLAPLLAELDELGEAMREVTSLRTGLIRLGISPMVGSLFMTPILIAFNDRYPDVELKLFEGGSQTIRGMLMQNKLDLGICIRGDEEDPAISDVLLLCDEVAAFVHRDNRLAACHRLHFEQLRDERFNLYDSGSLLTEQIISRCMAAGFLPKINLRSSKAHFLMQMTAYGRGICLLPRPYAARFALPELKAIPFEKRFDWKCYLMRRRDGYLSFAARAFAEYLIEAYPEGMGLHGIPSAERKLFFREYAG